MLTPAAQNAALLIDRVSRQHLRAGRIVWTTPVIRDLSSWVRESYEQRWLNSDAAPRVLEEVEERLIWRELVSASPLARELDDPAAAARGAQAAYLAMQDFEIPPAALQEFPGAETEALLRWSSDFEARCRELHALPVYRLLPLLRPSEPRPVPLEGIGWRPAALRWLGRNAAPPLAPVCRLSPAQMLGRIYTSADAELLGCAHWLRARNNADADFRALVIVPDLASRRTRVDEVFDAVFEPERFALHESRDAPAYAISGGVALAQFAPVRLALQSARCCWGPVPFAEFSALLRDPALQGDLSEAVAAARLDRELRRCCPHQATLTEWLRRCAELAANCAMAEPVAVARLRALRDELWRDSARAPMSHWARVLITAWEAGPWASRAHWSSVAYQSVQRLRELLHTLARASGTFGLREPAAALNIVAAAALDTAFQPQTGVAPIWITSQLLDPWLDFDAIWVVGTEASSWPPAPQPVPLLPVQLQRRHGIAAASAEGQWQQANELLERWRARAASLLLSGVSEGEASTVGVLPGGTKLEAGVDAGADSGAEVPAAADSDAGPDWGPEPHWRRLAQGAPPLQCVDDQVGPAWDRASAIRGVAVLRSQSRCPFRGFSVSRLAAQPLEFPEPGFSAIERGNILHKALELLWGRLQGSATLLGTPASELQARIEAAVGAAVDAVARQRDPGPVWRRRERRRLLNLLPRWFELEARRMPFTVQDLESKCTLTLAGLDVSMRIDRIDRLSDGRLVLLDYKSGLVGRDWTDERPENPQLPAYALCAQGPLAAVAYAQIRGSECRFHGVAQDADVLPRVNARYLEGDGFEAQLGVWRERLTLIAQELHDGLAVVAPRDKACNDCVLQGLCRIGEDAYATDADGSAGEGA